jgi:hypothetical protein
MPAPDLPAAAPELRRLSRSAMLAFAATITACGRGGTWVPIYGAPAPDASVDAPQDGEPIDDAPRDAVGRLVVPAYGLPPSDE